MNIMLVISSCLALIVVILFHLILSKDVVPPAAATLWKVIKYGSYIACFCFLVAAFFLKSEPNVVETTPSSNDFSLNKPEEPANVSERVTPAITTNFWPAIDREQSLRKSLQDAYLKPFDLILEMAYGDKKSAKTDREKHPELAGDPLREMGGYYYELGHYNFAKRYFEKALEIDKKSLKNGHAIEHIVALDKSRLGGALEALGEYEEALGLFEEAKESYENLNGYGNQSPEIGYMWNLIGGIQFSYGESDGNPEGYELAKEAFKNSSSYFLKDQKEQLSVGKHTFHVSTVYRNLGNTLLKLDQLEEANDYLYKALEYDQKIKDENPIGEALTLMHIGSLKLRTRKYEEAVDTYKGALNLYIKHLGVSGDGKVHSHVAKIISKLGESYAGIGKKEENPARVLEHDFVAVSHTNGADRQKAIAKMQNSLSRLATSTY